MKVLWTPEAEQDRIEIVEYTRHEWAMASGARTASG